MNSLSVVHTWNGATLPDWWVAEWVMQCPPFYTATSLVLFWHSYNKIRGIDINIWFHTNYDLKKIMKNWKHGITFISHVNNDKTPPHARLKSVLKGMLWWLSYIWVGSHPSENNTQSDIDSYILQVLMKIFEKIQLLSLYEANISHLCILIFSFI